MCVCVYIYIFIERERETYIEVGAIIRHYYFHPLSPLYMSGVPVDQTNKFDMPGI